MIQPDSVHIPFFILHYIYIHIYASILTASKFQRSHPPFDFWTVPYHIVCDIYILIYPIIPMVAHGVHSLCWWKYNDFQAFASPNQRMLHPMFDITILLAI